MVALPPLPTAHATPAAPRTIRDLHDAIAEACAAVGLDEPKKPCRPGEWVRCDVTDAGRHGRGDGSVKVFFDGQGAIAHNWQTGDWVACFVGQPDAGLPPAEREERARRREEERAKAEAELARQRQEAARVAQAIIEAASGEIAGHPYLVKKGLPDLPNVRTLALDDFRQKAGYFPKADGDPFQGLLLVAPVIAADGTVRTLELIDEAGRKAGLAKGARKGHFWTPDDRWRTAKTVILAEGIATAWSIASALENEDAAVVATLSANNLEAAGRAILEARGDTPPELVVAADLGDGGEPFPLAREAAKHLGARLAAPTPPEGRDARGFDFDDMRQLQGLAAVRQAITAAPSETTPRAELFKEIPLDELDNAPPPSFLVEHWIPEGEVVLLAAHGGSGKSILSLTLAAHVAAGRPFCGLSVQRRKVAFLSFEDHDPILRHRLRQVLAAYGMTPGEMRGNLRVFDASEAGALVTEASAAGTRFLTSCEAWGAMEKLDADLVIIDGASDTFDANENERRFVRGFISMLRGLARKRGGAVLLLAHLPKETKAGMNYSGSTGWHNSVRARLSMTRDDNGFVTVSQEKSNHGPCAGAKVFTFADGGVLVPTEPGEVAAVKGTDPRLIDEAVLEAIREAYQSGNPISTADRGPNNAAQVLQDLLRGKWNTVRRDQISPALTRLAVSGKIRRTEWTTPARKRREVWAPADDASPSPEAANPPDDAGAPVAPVALVSPLIPPMPETGATGAPGSGEEEGLRQFPENQKPAQLAQLAQAPGEAAAASDLALEEGDLLAPEDDELIL